jgi:hypothetical protein
MFAAVRRHLDIVRILLEAGVDSNDNEVES